MDKRKKNKTKVCSSTIEGVQLVGNDSEWGKLPGRICTIVKNNGLARLSHIRKQISADANLPMPKICVDPYAFVGPDYCGVFYALVRIITTDVGFEYGVVMGAATLIAIDDDVILRRILCHEFAHCFWLIIQLLRAGRDGKFCYVDKKAKKDASNEDILKIQLEKDSHELIEPKRWFGKSDAENLIHCEKGENPILDESTNKLQECWIDIGLPTKEPDLHFRYHGDIKFDDAIIEHVCGLEGWLLTDLKFLKQKAD